MRNKSIILSLVFALALVLSACAQPSVAQEPTEKPPMRTLNVNGSAQVQLPPDIAYISIGVHTEHENASKAVSQNSAQATRVMDAIKAMGIEAKDIRTTNFSIYPQQQYGQNGEMLGIKYIVDNTVYLTLRDLNKIGDVLGTATEAGANSIGGIQFDVADKTTVLTQARKTAVENARQMAAELAQSAGVTLGDIQSINFNSYYPTPVYAEAKGGDMAAMAPSIPISSGTLTISVDVYIVYEIK